MSDIPDWAFEEADKHFIPVQTEVTVAAVREVVARAIMAATERERARVEKLADGFPDTIDHPGGPLYGAGFAAAVQHMRRAIRKESKPQNDNFKSIPHLGPVA
jgi:hypothetical protein